MIVVEGFDCSGKSTLAARIGAELGWPVLHPGGPTNDEQDVYNCLLRSLSRMRQRCVQDRITHISESVYSMLRYPQKAAIALCAMREVAHAELVVYCRPPTEMLLDSLRDHAVKEHDDPEKLAKTLEDAPTLIRLYDTVMHLAVHYCGVRVLKHDRAILESEEHILSIVRRKFK